MSSLKIALIGCGAATRRYYVEALKKNPHLREGLFLVDRNIVLAEAIRDELGGGRVKDDYHDIIDEVQGAIIVVPHFLHHSIAMDFLEAGVAVLCEKPLAESPHQAREMINSAQVHNTVLCVNNTRRMFPSFQAVKDIISRGEIGRLRSITYTEGNAFAWPSTTGFYVNPQVSSKGVLLDIGSHVLDTLCWWLSGKPLLERCEDDSFGGPESIMKIRARHDGCTLDIILNRLCDLPNTYRIEGELGTVEGEIFEWGTIRLRSSTGGVQQRKLNNPIKNYPGFVIPIVDNFIQALKGRSAPLVDGADVLDSLDFLHECYENRHRLDLGEYKANALRETLPAKITNRRGPGKVLVTGATGFIGGRIVEMMHLTGAREVRAAIRQWSSAARLGRFPVDISLMDLIDRKQIGCALEGVTEIIHCAKGNAEVTVEGTRNLCEVALDKGIKRFIHLSTAEVYGNAEGVINEDHPYQYTGNEYNRMKIEAEKICWEYNTQGLPLVVVRPSIVYGPFSRNWTMKFAHMLVAGELSMYENYGEGKCNLVYVDDLVRAILLALETDSAVGQAFNISGPDLITWNEYFKRYNEMLRLGPLKTIRTAQTTFKTAMMEPVRMLGGFVRDHFLAPVKKIAETFEYADRLMRIAEHAVKTTPSPDELRLYTKDATYSALKAEELMHFQSSVSLHAGLERTVEWLRYQGLIVDGRW